MLRSYPNYFRIQRGLCDEMLKGILRTGIYWVKTTRPSRFYAFIALQREIQLNLPVTVDLDLSFRRF